MSKTEILKENWLEMFEAESWDALNIDSPSFRIQTFWQRNEWLYEQKWVDIERRFDEICEDEKKQDWEALVAAEIEFLMTRVLPATEPARVDEDGGKEKKLETRGAGGQASGDNMMDAEIFVLVDKAKSSGVSEVKACKTVWSQLSHMGVRHYKNAASLRSAYNRRRNAPRH